MPQPNRRRPTNLSIDNALLSEARELKLNLSRAAEAGIRAAVREARADLWRRENLDALQSSNDYAERNGLPLSDHRVF